ncbi:hypothetical protein DMENIID0001_020330 [Sergentomyia squamirostris]
MVRNLFKDVTYYVTGEFDLKVKELLDNGGSSSSRFLLDDVTHVICGANFDDNDVDQALERYDVPPITEDWVRASIKLGRLAGTKRYEIKHGVVPLAIRDSKICVTACWLNETIIRRQVQPPWQANHLPTTF